MRSSGVVRLLAITGLLAIGLPLKAEPATPDQPAAHEVTAPVGAEEPATCCALPSRWAVVAAAKATAERVTIEPSAEGQRVLIDGAPFAEYRTDTGRQPAVWPIVGPSGHEMTRSLPLGPKKPTETDDHPHHESLWFSHGEVNGHDFWQGGKNTPPAERPHITHQDFVRREIVDGAAVIETTNAWVADDQTVMTDRRKLAFGELPAGDADTAPRYIDFTIDLIASHGPVTLGDTKEGSFGVRVAGPMKLEADLGGGITNSRGEQDDATWGRPAEWVDYHGPLTALADKESASGPQGGIVVMCHPESFRPACRWHVRGYGLFAANPFGAHHFPKEGPSQGAVELADGDSLTLSYRVIFYAGDEETAHVTQWFDDYSATPVTAN